MGKSDDYIKQQFPLTEEGGKDAERLCGYVFTARQGLFIVEM
jgi:hypothetical protein